MVEKADIIVNFNSLCISSRKSITGEIYFLIGDRYFPEEGWNDFVIIILSWWHKALINIKNSQTNTTHEFDFMDGPLVVKATKISENNLKLDFIKENSDTQEIFFTSISNFFQLEKSLMDVTKRLLKEINLKGWHSDEIEELEKMFNILKG
ncbi:hypothetical protein [Neobacillus sp. OS1-33]|jgi:hypothetical protein|uniref:hypothetical protein n=1 Tax=Neobacillus sp. OS1-33 TaxID=3070683 RepID=UPI0027E20308|nr:hypothetical protein [Neobacillus sp. OS1-33]WML26147.1 hypothetical protein RCG22_00415 [Neobacillus sp. OS1-33]